MPERKKQSKDRKLDSGIRKIYQEFQKYVDKWITDNKNLK